MCLAIHWGKVNGCLLLLLERDASVHARLLARVARFREINLSKFQPVSEGMRNESTTHRMCSPLW